MPIIIRMLCWLIVAFIGAVLVSAIGKLTGTIIEDRDFAGGVVFRITLILYGYLTLTMFSWVFS